jgi:polysaccharide deacetylase family sporulation protein PdaB
MNDKDKTGYASQKKSATLKIATVTALSAFLVFGVPKSSVFAATPDMQKKFAMQPMQKEPNAIFQVQTTKKMLALTFDISWGEKTPGPVLDVLQKKKIDKATFFLTGEWTLQHPELAKRIKEMGFEIGSHGYDHKKYTEHDDIWIDNQVRKAESAIEQVTGEKPNLIRTQSDDFDKRVLTRLNTLGYTVTQWRTDSLDRKNPGVQSIVEHVVTQSVPGDIVLLHAGDCCKQTADALPLIIDELRKKGYKFVTVSELLAETEVKSKLE